MMTVEKGTSKNPVHAYVIADDNDAKFVVYAADKLNGAANKDDIVYLDDDCDTRVSSSAYEGTLWFMKDLSDKDVSIDDDGKTKQGFYKYSIDSKGVYKLETANGLSDGEVSDNADGYAKDVVFETGKSTSLTSAAASTSVDATSYDNKVAFVGTSMKNATRYRYPQLQRPQPRTPTPTRSTPPPSWCPLWIRAWSWPMCTWMTAISSSLLLRCARMPAPAAAPPIRIRLLL